MMHELSYVYLFFQMESQLLHQLEVSNKKKTLRKECFTATTYNSYPVWVKAGARYFATRIFIAPCVQIRPAS